MIDARRDVVVVVDDADNALGTMDKLQAHKEGGTLHRAISVCLFDDRGRVLLQRRSPAKYHFGGLWSNACCTHPMPGESTSAAARRRVHEELGVAISRLHHCGTFAYRARDTTSGLVEHELDHVFAGICRGQLMPDREEVNDLAWCVVDPDHLDQFHGPRYTPWLATVLSLACSVSSLHTDEATE